jgi:hypothetical protein
MDNRYKNAINSGITVASNNLKPWKPGISGNPAGRPKGSRNIKKVIQDLLNDPGTVSKLDLGTPRDTEYQKRHPKVP